MTLVPDALRLTARRAFNPAAFLSLRAQLRRLRKRYIQSQDKHGRILLAVQIVYAVLLGFWFIFSHTWPSPDMIAICLLAFAFLAARGLSFLRDWSPFVLLLLGYIALTGVASSLAAHVHIGFPISFDRWLFRGTLPTTFLQQHLWNPHHIHWYDYLATSLYPMHFIVPLVLAFAFWMWKKPLYWRFVASYLLLSYAGFVTYTLYPMAPPWWAADHARIGPTADILSAVHYGNLPNPIVSATQFFKPNELAAMPSIHAAFPILVWLVLWRTWPKWGWSAVAYPIAMAFSVVYLGQHYVTDVLAGWLYAVVAYYLIWEWGSGRSPRRWASALMRRFRQVDDDRTPVAGRVTPIALRPRLGVSELQRRDVVTSVCEGCADNVSGAVERRSDVAAG
jgi:membrane-associated phospholipid phosphatase